MFVNLAVALSVALTLPAPSGPSPIGTVEFRLVDRSRADPWVAAQPYRELMVSIWYPARRTSGLPLAPQMGRGAAEDFGKTLAPALFGTKPGEVDWGATMTHARAGAPMRRGLPVVLFSPGFGAPRTVGDTLVEELASRGYAVVSIDHTYEAAQVEFPGGRVERSRFPAQPTQEDMKKAQAVRVADTRFVLDRLEDVEGLDLSRVGMFGHSMGGATAAEVTHDDPRVDAGVNLDGGFRGPVAQTGVAKPFLQVAAENHTRESDPTWRSFWDESTGWKRELRFTGAAHYSFTDAETWAHQLGRGTELVGTIDPERAVEAERAYTVAFFDLFLKGRRTPLFDRPGYPEVKIIR